MNPGYNPEKIAALKEQCRVAGRSFVYNTNEESNEEGAYFYFVGKDGEGKEVIYDTFLYLLRSEYEMAVYDLAEQRLADKFPDYKGLEEATEDQLDYLDLLVDEIEGEDEVRVVENISVDESHDYGIGLDACLNLDAVTDEEIENFVKAFNEETLELDDTEYSFSYAQDDDDAE